VVIFITMRNGAFYRMRFSAERSANFLIPLFSVSALQRISAICAVRGRSSGGKPSRAISMCCQWFMFCDVRMLVELFDMPRS